MTVQETIGKVDPESLHKICIVKDSKVEIKNNWFRMQVDTGASPFAGWFYIPKEYFETYEDTECADGFSYRAWFKTNELSDVISSVGVAGNIKSDLTQVDKVVESLKFE